MKKIPFLMLLLVCVIVFNGQTNALKSQYDPALDIVSAGWKDQKGNLWFAVSNRGVYCYDGKSFINFTVKDGLNDNSVSCIYEDKTGMIWFGTKNGACYYDGKTFKNISFPVSDSSKTYMSKYSNLQGPRSVGGILQDKGGNFWFVTLRHGVYRYDGKSFTNYLPNEVLLCILEDRLGNIWVGSWQHGGVYRYDGKSFTNFSGLSDDMIKCMMQDKAGNIWIGTRDHGVDRYDGKSITNFSEKEGLYNNDVSCIIEDKKGNIWFGSDVAGGIKRGDAFCYNGKSFINVTSKEVLTVKEGLVYSVMTIVEDKNGAFWFGSRGGRLICYDGKSFVDFSEEVSAK